MLTPSSSSTRYKVLMTTATTAATSHLHIHAVDERGGAHPRWSVPLSYLTILRSDIDLGAILLGLEMFFLCLMIPLERASWDDSPQPDFSAYVRRKPRRGDRVIRGGKKVSERARVLRVSAAFRLSVFLRPPSCGAPPRSRLPESERLSVARLAVGRRRT